jgi:rubrerythrin
MSRPKYRRPKVHQEIGVRCLRRNGISTAMFRSAAKARQAIRDRKSADVPLYIYQCPRCGYWHITSQPQRP